MPGDVFFELLVATGAAFAGAGFAAQLTQAGDVALGDGVDDLTFGDVQTRAHDPSGAAMAVFMKSERFHGR